MNASHFSEDCLEFIALLNKHGVRFVIVGGEAVIYYGYARLDKKKSTSGRPKDQEDLIYLKSI
jgi:hypothetical protein